MLALPVSLALAVVFLYGVFLVWYGGRAKPLTHDEIETGLRQLAERHQDAQSQAGLQDVRDLLAHDDGREFVMQNLVRYRARAEYPPGYNFDDDPRKADRRYGRAILWPLLRYGNHPMFIARRSGRFIDPDHVRGEVPRAYVVLRANMTATPEEIQYVAFCRGNCSFLKDCFSKCTVAFSM